MWRILAFNKRLRYICAHCFCRASHFLQFSAAWKQHIHCGNDNKNVGFENQWFEKLLMKPRRHLRKKHGLNIKFSIGAKYFFDVWKNSSKISQRCSSTAANGQRHGPADFCFFHLDGVTLMVLHWGLRRFVNATFKQILTSHPTPPHPIPSHHQPNIVNKTSPTKHRFT